MMAKTEIAARAQCHTGLRFPFHSRKARAPKSTHVPMMVSTISPYSQDTGKTATALKRRGPEVTGNQTLQAVQFIGRSTRLK